MQGFVVKVDYKTHHVRLKINTTSSGIIDISASHVNTYKLLDVYPQAFAKSSVTNAEWSMQLL
jgi:triacylglycerol esterase/lipase EstA (alpha/beta hydrolase family)